jgi:hypothetical protein
MMKKTQRKEYLDNFSEDGTPSVRSAALEEAREVRKFEIDLYWRRAAYFWLFIAAAFGGYSTLQDNKQQALAFLIACLGFIFSLAWYFVNRGSKFWQQNWEMHVDLLEDSTSGPIYKTVLQRSQKNFCKLNGPYPFSVSKINQLLSLFVAIAWLMLIARTFAIVWEMQFALSPRCATILTLSCTFVAAIVLFRYGRTDDDVQIDKSCENVPIGKFYESRRTYE